MSGENGKITFSAELKERVTAELANIKQAVAGTKSVFSSAMGSIKGYVAGAFGVAAIAGFARSIVAYAGAVKDAAEASGMPTTRFQALTLTARNNGIEMNRVVAIMARLQDVQGSVADNKSLQRTFEGIGISVKEVQSMEPDQLLQRIASGIRRTGNASAAFDIFGRSAAKMLTTLNELADGWDALVSKTRGGIITEDDIERIDRMGDKLEDVKSWTMAIGAQIGTTVADIADIVGRLTAGDSLDQAFRGQTADQNAGAAAREKQKKDAAQARAASMQAQQEQKDADALTKAKEEGSKLGEDFQQQSLSDKQMEAILQAKVNALVEDANAQGLTALDRQLRQNEALKVSLDLLEVQKRIKDDQDRANAASQKSRDEEVQATDAAEEKKQKYLFSKMTPEQQLKQTESDIVSTQQLLGKNSPFDDPKWRAQMMEHQVSNLETRDRLQADRSAKIKEARDNIDSASKPRTVDSGLRDVQQRMRDVRSGRTPQDDPARESVANLKIIVANTKRIAELSGGPQ